MNWDILDHARRSSGLGLGLNDYGLSPMVNPILPARPMSQTEKRGTSPRDGGSRRLGVILVDPFHVAREGIGLLIDTQPDLEVLVRAGTADEALEDLRRLRRRADLVALVAVEVDGQHDGYWLIHELREQFPQIRIVASAALPDRMAVSRALFVGADGFIHKRAHPVEFLDGLRRAGAGEMVLAGVPREWLGPIAGDVERQGETAWTLTAREREVLSVAAEGLTARGIATRLALSERTVTTHLANIYGKLGVNSRVAAVTTAARKGLVVVGGRAAELDRVG